MWPCLYRFASPPYFYRFIAKVLPMLAIACTLLFAYGLWDSLWFAPPDAQQGEAYRIIFIHVPSAFMSLLIYACMAVMAFIYLVWRIKMADIVLYAIAPIGATFTALALVTGMLWGKPMWGAWWVWDARLTSELILLLLYFGVMGLQGALREKEGFNSPPAILTLIGSVNIPIIHYSVYWWHTLHQASTLSVFKKPSIATSMLYPLLVMLGAFVLYAFLVTLLRIRYVILQREQARQWVRQL